MDEPVYTASRGNGSGSGSGNGNSNGKGKGKGKDGNIAAAQMDVVEKRKLWGFGRKRARSGEGVVA